MAGYTAYCTCFYEPSVKKVFFYDEIEDLFLKKQDVKDKEEADKEMDLWVNSAPDGVICQQIS